jgi:hypothetical protein
MPDGAVGPGLILVDAEGADEGIASFIAAMGAFRHFAHENAPRRFDRTHLALGARQQRSHL